jgi:hypothetical protein
MQLNQHDLHNVLVPEIIRSIVRPVQQTGGSPADIMMILESVNAGIIAYVTEGTEPGPRSKGTLADARRFSNILNRAVKERLEAIINRSKP